MASGMDSTDRIVKLVDVRTACKRCSLQRLCLPMHIAPQDMSLLERIIQRRRPIRRGEHLFHSGDRFHALYTVRSGSVKSYTGTEGGQEQVTGFHLPGELVAMDGIGTGSHPSAAKALETTSVCEIPFERLEDLANRIPSLQHHLFRLMSQEITQDHEMLLTLGKMHAEARLASFLLSISSRFRSRGFSPTEFMLSMSRNDIGNYLGLAVETVSRLFTRFQEEGILSVDRKHVLIHRIERLHELAGRHGAGPDRASGGA